MKNKGIGDGESNKDLYHKYESDSDHSSIKKASVWFLWGVLIVAAVLYGLYHFYTYSQFQASQNTAIQAEYPVMELRERERQHLNSLERLSDEDPVYRIPVDSAMTLLIKYREE